jgi:hypothetical protein
LAGAKSRGLKDSTLGKLKTLCERQLLQWAKKESLVYLDELTTANLTDFRNGWKEAYRTSMYFFRFLPRKLLFRIVMYLPLSPQQFAFSGSQCFEKGHGRHPTLRRAGLWTSQNC